ncbi:MAG: sel1 repeat family protein [Verrucomicrobia bacterium]|nr:sel1 repeat family protein [Verrucomicrobiota bacterium]
MNSASKRSWFAAILACLVLTLGLTACEAGKDKQTGSGPPQLTKDQIKEWEQAADKGDAHDKFALGKKFRDGVEVAQNFTNAAVWFRKASEAGHAKAQYQLALSYREGHGVAKDEAEAAKWLLKASEQGNGNAMEELGFMLWKGQGVTTNYVEAHKWLTLAAAEGEGKAAKGAKKLELSMNPQQIAEAKKLEASFIPKKVFTRPDKKKE